MGNYVTVSVIYLIIKVVVSHNLKMLSNKFQSFFSDNCSLHWYLTSSLLSNIQYHSFIQSLHEICAHDYLPFSNSLQIECILIFLIVCHHYSFIYSLYLKLSLAFQLVFTILVIVKYNHSNSFIHPLCNPNQWKKA